MENNQSIFETICRLREEEPGLPYRFQDERTAGQKDVLYVLASEGIPFWRKEDLAKECCGILKDLVNKEDTILTDPVLRHFLEHYPICSYFIELRERVRITLEAETSSRERLFHLGMRLARSGTDPEQVKLGIILLGFFPYDTTKQIMRVLGYHSEYTLYVLESIQYVFPMQNNFIFELAKHTVGYGKLAAMFLLKPVRWEQQHWMMHEGIKSDFLANIYTNLCIQKTDMRAYFKKTEITAANFTDFAYLICYADYNNDSLTIDAQLDFLYKFIEKRDFAKNFIDLGALVSIWYQVVDFWQQDYDFISQNETKYRRTKTMWDTRIARYEKLVHKVESFLHQPKWRHIVYQEISAPNESDNLIMKVLVYLNMHPDFPAFMEVLSRQPLGFNMLDFFLKINPEFYFDDVCEYLEAILNPDLYALPLEIEEPENPSVTDLMRADEWLLRLFEVMSEKRKYNEVWCIRGIHYRHAGVRKKAVQVLLQNRKKWSDQVERELQIALEKEPNSNLKRQINRLLQPENQKDKKESRYLKSKQPPLSYAHTDKELVHTYIAGTQFHELSGVADFLKPGDLLQLARETDNAYDANAIAVATQAGYMLGYVPRSENAVLANLIDAEERLYAILESPTVEMERPKITIVLKRTFFQAQPNEQGQGIILPFPPPKKKKYE